MTEIEMLQLSPSRISDYQQCPALYKYRAIDKLPERPGLDALRGSLVHLIIEKLFKLPAAKRDFDSAISLTSDCWDELLAAEPEIVCALDSGIAFPLQDKVVITQDRLDVLFAEVKVLIANYYSLEDPTKVEPHSTEELIEFDLSPALKIKGYVDRIDKSPQGWIRINDYKTGKSPNKQFQEKAMFQLKFYALVIYKMSQELPKMLRLLYMKDSQVLALEPNIKDIEITLQKVESVAEQIFNSKATSTWPTQVSKLCDYCYFKPICPEFQKN